MSANPVLNRSRLSQRINSLRSIKIDTVYRNPRFLSNLLKLIKDGAREKGFICIKRLRSIDRKEKE